MRGTKWMVFVLPMFTVCCLSALSQAPAKDAGGFQVCHKEYALCTFSQCGSVQVLGAQATTMWLATSERISPSAKNVRGQRNLPMARLKSCRAIIRSRLIPGVRTTGSGRCVWIHRAQSIRLIQPIRPNRSRRNANARWYPAKEIGLFNQEPPSVRMESSPRRL